METRLRHSLNVFPDLDALSRAVAQSLVVAIADAPRFVIALSGGGTPKTLYRLLASEYQEQIPWERVHVLWADERYVAPSGPESNVGMVRDELLAKIPLPETNIHAPRTDFADPDEAARSYERAIRDVLDAELRIDRMILGLGEDGHTASIFPGSAVAQERERLVVAVRDSPKPPPTRLTMTPALILRAREIDMLVAGASKRRPLHALVDGRAMTWLEEAIVWADRAAAGD